MVDGDDGVAAGRGEADAQLAVVAAARMHGDAAAAGAMGIDQVIDRAGDAGVGQRVDHDLALPRPIGVRLPVLDGAAAAGAEIAAERRDPLRAGAFDTQQAAALGMAGDRVGLDGLAGQRVRHEDGVSAGEGDAVAAMADMVDGEVFSHGARR